MNLTAAALGANVHAAWPEVPLATAVAHAQAAIDAATPDLPAELLLAIDDVETDFDATSVSPVGGMFGGPLQAMCHGSHARCRALSVLAVGYAAGVEELTEWMARTHGNLALALGHHACGNLVTRRCRAYAGHVMRERRALTAIAGRLPAS